MTFTSEEILEELLLNQRYYFFSEQKLAYAVLYIKESSTNEFQIQIKEGIPIPASPLEYEKAKTRNIKYEGKEALYNGASKQLNQLLEQTYLEEFNQETITGLLMGREGYAPDLRKLKAAYEFKDVKGKVTRYDIFDYQISVNRVKVKNNTYESELLYSLWYTKEIEVNNAMAKVIGHRENDELTKFENIEAFMAYVNAFRKSKNKELPRPEDILFEHRIDPEVFVSKELSGLQHHLPDSPFKSFDIDDIEEGRLYFWVENLGKDLLKSKAIFFVLQNRKRSGYLVSDKIPLSTFNHEYSQYNYISHSSSSLYEELKTLVKKVAKKKWTEIPQEQVIEALTKKDFKTIHSQNVIQSIYFSKQCIDIYENAIQVWMEDTDDGTLVYHTYFFEDKNKKESFLKKMLVERKSWGTGIREKSNNKKLLEKFTSIHETNKNYLVQKPLKDKMFQEHPQLKKILKGYRLRDVYNYSPLKIIEGNWESNENLNINANKESIIVMGDLIVKGSLTSHSKKDSDNFLIVLGDVIAENYIHKASFSVMAFAGNMIVSNITYLPAASRAWYFYLVEELKTTTLIHAQKEPIKAKDERIVFEKEFSIKDDGIFQEWYKASNEAKALYNVLMNGEDIFLKEMASEDTIKKARQLSKFKSHLSEWYSIYYIFAGFKKLELECGMHYGHHIESDEILDDLRHGTGKYLMSHDNYSLTLVKKEKELHPNIVVTKQLAYRFFWIMWTFSNWKHRADGPMDYWKTIEALDAAYLRDKSFFTADPNVALYWLMHFGLLEDERFQEVKELLHDMDNDLVQGAFLFFKELKELKTYTINVDWQDKNNTTLFANRVAGHKSEIEKMNLSKDDLTFHTLVQFKKQPDKVLVFLHELYESKEWEKVKTYLETYPYQVGYSFLHLFINEEEDKNKWYSKFLQECQDKQKDWKKSYLLIEFMELIFKDLNFIQRERAIAIVFHTNLNSDSTQRLQNLIDWHRKQKNNDPKEVVQQEMANLVANINKEKFDFQEFMNHSFGLSKESIPVFIRQCMEADLFSNVCGKGTICHYLVMYWVEDFFMGTAEVKAEICSGIITTYNLSKDDFFANTSIQKTPKGERNALFKMIKKYL